MDVLVLLFRTWWQFCRIHSVTVCLWRQSLRRWRGLTSTLCRASEASLCWPNRRLDATRDTESSRPSDLSLAVRSYRTRYFTLGVIHRPRKHGVSRGQLTPTFSSVGSINVVWPPPTFSCISRWLFHFLWRLAVKSGCFSFISIIIETFLEIAYYSKTANS